MIRADKNNSDVLVVDTLKDIFKLLATHQIRVRISDYSKLRDLDIEEELERSEDE
tara:strand:- start:701 stop:865 length:165 start_codon:yes stop_codon:yes gene_type:complete